MTAMSANYANYEMADVAPSIYARVLQDIPDDLLEAAAINIMASPGAFFPTVGDWRQSALDLQWNELGIPSSFEAWQEVMTEIRRCSDYYKYTPEQGRKDPVWSTPLVENAVAAIGYRQILESDNIDITRAHFYKAYDAIKNRREKQFRMLPEVRLAAEKYMLEEPSIPALPCAQ